MNRHSVQRQRIGPAIRRMREEPRFTLVQLADVAAVSPSHLSRVERNQTLPSFSVLAKIAFALDVDINDFVRIEQDVTQLDDLLARFARRLALSRETEQELTNLSIEARRELVGRLDELEEFSVTPRDVQDLTVRSIEYGKEGQPFVDLAPVIARLGISPVCLSQLLLVLSLLHADRVALISGPSLLPIFPGHDLYAAYRKIFPRAPIDPLVTNWWNQASFRTKERELQGRLQRIIISEHALDSALGPFIARSLLDERSTSAALEIAVTERSLGEVNFMSVGGEYGLLERLPVRRTDRRQSHVAVWLVGQNRVALCDEVVEKVWNTLRTEERDQQMAAGRLREFAGQSD